MEWGCTTKAVVPVHFDGELTYQCPRRPLLDNPGYAEALNVFGWYKSGHLPDPGQWPDQSQVFIQVVAVIEKAMSDAEARD